MATKPTTVPGWAPTDPSKIVEPAAGDKTDGFDPGEKPPAQWFNWFWKLLSGWAAYLKDGYFVGESGQPGINATGGTTGNTNGVEGIPNANGHGVYGTSGVGTGDGVRGDGGVTGRGVFGKSSNALDAVRGQNLSTGYGVNGTSTTGTGVRGFTSAGSAPAVLGDSFGGEGVYGTSRAAGGAGVRGVAASGGPGVAGVGDGAGPGGTFSKGGSTTIGVTTDGNVKLTGSAPATSAPFTNELTPLSMFKAWAVVAANNTVTPTLIAGMNVSSVAQEVSGGFDGRYTMTLASAMSTATFPVIVLAVGGSPQQALAEIDQSAASHTVFKFRPQVAHTLLYPTASDQNGVSMVYFVGVLGAQ